MPELPEVEIICRGLANKLIGRKIVKVEVLRPDSIAYPNQKNFAKLLAKHKFQAFCRRGKYLLIYLDHKSGLVVHLRMSGRFLLVESKKKFDAHLRVRFILDYGQELHFIDQRVFGRLWFVPAGKTFEQIVPGLAKLGVEPMTNLNGKFLTNLLHKRKRSIKSLLLDQTVVAGIGNIYADEVLFQAKIKPMRLSNNLSSGEVHVLVKQIKKVLLRAIACGGSSIKNFTDSDGINGNYQQESFVYDRAGEPCRHCSTLIKRVRLAGRSTHFCPHCQI